MSINIEIKGCGDCPYYIYEPSTRNYCGYTGCAMLENEKECPYKKMGT